MLVRPMKDMSPQEYNVQVRNAFYHQGSLNVQALATVLYQDWWPFICNSYDKKECGLYVNILATYYIYDILLGKADVNFITTIEFLGPCKVHLEIPRFDRALN